MKLSTSTVFDVSVVSGTNSYKELTPYFDYLGVFTTEVVQAFNKRVNFSDNFEYEEKSLSLQNGVSVSLGDRTISSILVRCTTPVLSYRLIVGSDSKKYLSVFFKDTRNVKAKYVNWVSGTVVKCQIEDATNVDLGDFVNISGFSTAANNGTYQVISMDTSNRILYLNNFNRTSSTGDELRTGFTGAAKKTYSCVVGIFA